MIARRPLEDSGTCLGGTCLGGAAIVRSIEQEPERELSNDELARGAEIGPYRFPRAFAQATGTTPHQLILRTRLREAARHIPSESGSLIDIAFGCGFGDVSNFNHRFRAELGTSPRGFRVRLRSSSGNPRSR